MRGVGSHPASPQPAAVEAGLPSLSLGEAKRDGRAACGVHVPLPFVDRWALGVAHTPGLASRLRFLGLRTPQFQICLHSVRIFEFTVSLLCSPNGVAYCCPPKP